MYETRDEHPMKNHALVLLIGWGCIMATVLSLAMCGGCQRVKPSEHPRSVLEQHRETVSLTVMCIADDGSEIQMFIATGMRLSRTQVLTAAHVVKAPAGHSCMYMGLQLGAKETLMLSPGVVDEARDLATFVTIAGSFDEPEPVSIGAVPELGETICEVAGVPYHVRRCGEVQLSHKEMPHMIDSTMIVEPGNSGSPVYNVRGELVGVVSAMWSCGNGQICGSFVASMDDAEMQKLRGEQPRNDPIGGAK